MQPGSLAIFPLQLLLSKPAVHILSPHMKGEGINEGPCSRDRALNEVINHYDEDNLVLNYLLEILNEMKYELKIVIAIEYGLGSC